MKSKHLLLCYSAISAIALHGASRKPQNFTSRCNNCQTQQQKPDPIPPLMAQHFFTVLTNGFIALQNNNNKDIQNDAVVNALNGLSNIVQLLAQRSARLNEKLTIDEFMFLLQNSLNKPDIVLAISQYLGSSKTSFLRSTPTSSEFRGRILR